MEIRSVLVNIDIGSPNAPSLEYAIDLARQFDAELIGLAADQPNLAYLGVDGSGAAVDFYNAESAAVEEQLARAEDAFKSIVPAAVKHQWRAYVAPQTRSLIDCAGLADVVVTASSVTNAFGNKQNVGMGELVLGAGRPVINVGQSDNKAGFDKIFIGWKDTREARRAVADALPLLKRAREVVALTVSEERYVEERQSMADLGAWLGGHGIAARTDILNDAEGTGDLLQVTALEEKADLLVIGAYGHTRMREWLFGGVTRSVLDTEQLNRLLSN